MGTDGKFVSNVMMQRISNAGKSGDFVVGDDKKKVFIDRIIDKIAQVYNVLFYTTKTFECDRITSKT